MCEKKGHPVHTDGQNKKNKFVSPRPCQVKATFDRFLDLFSPAISRKILARPTLVLEFQEVFLPEIIHIEKSFCKGEQNCLVILCQISLF